MDLVDEMQWEDVIPAECMVSLEDAGFEEGDDDTPLFGYHDGAGSNGSIYSYTAWFYDGDESAFGIM